MSLSSGKGWLGIGTGIGSGGVFKYPGGVSLGSTWRWLGTWLTGTCGGVRLAIGLDNLKGLFQHK